MPDGIASQELALSIKIGTAAREAIWILVVRHRLRQGPAQTRELAIACDTAKRGQYLHGQFRYFMKKCPGVRVVGQAMADTGFMNNVYALEDLP